MMHLEKEFCNENLLFLTIIWQWRDRLLSKKLINDPFILFKDEYIKLPPNVPLSSIVSMNELNDNNNSKYQTRSTIIKNEANKQSHGLNSSINSDKSTDDILTDNVIPIFEAVYLKYIERNKAPLEMYAKYSS